MKILIKTIAFMLLFCNFIATSQAANLNVTVTDQSGNPVENAVVYLDSDLIYKNTESPSAAIEQKGKKFAPFVSVVQTGTMISFPNRDNVKHHVYSFSPAKTFELKLYSGVPANPVLFDKAGTVVLGCNIHDSMLAYVLVVDTPYFGKSDSAGKVVLNDVPSGKFTLKTWHPSLLKENIPAEQALNLKTSETLTVKIDIKNQ